MAMALVAARRSLCDGDQVGAVIVSGSNVVIATGYNGPPAGFQHGERTCTSWCPRQQNRDRPGFSPLAYAGCQTIHAEANALLSSERSQRIGGTIYVTSPPCWDCAKLIANSGIMEVVVRTNRALEERRNAMVTYEFLDKCGMNVVVVEDK
jgi:dCMP deaminase